MFLSRERVKHNEKCKFVLIKDTSQKSGRHFLHALASLFVKENTSVNYISYDLPSSAIVKSFQLDERYFKVHDAFSDPLKWERIDDSLSYTSPHILQHFCSIDNAATFVDSVSHLVYGASVESLYRCIHAIGTNNQLVLLLHADAHPVKVGNILESLATTILEILPTENEEPYIFRATVRSPNRKVIQEIIECHLKENGDIIYFKEILPIRSETPLKQPDPTANLTFNLKLTDDEKQNREKLLLPYAKVDEESLPSNISLEFQDDFYDEDDPDDDLDI